MSGTTKPPPFIALCCCHAVSGTDAAYGAVQAQHFAGTMASEFSMGISYYMKCPELVSFCVMIFHWKSGTSNCRFEALSCTLPCYAPRTRRASTAVVSSTLSSYTPGTRCPGTEGLCCYQELSPTIDLDATKCEKTQGYQDTMSGTDIRCTGLCSTSTRCPVLTQAILLPDGGKKCVLKPWATYRGRCTVRGKIKCAKPQSRTVCARNVVIAFDFAVFPSQTPIVALAGVLRS
eukprot:3940580-Rhodomonas_salina.1